MLKALQSQRQWLTQAMEETTLAQCATRNELQRIMVFSPALFQSTLFIAGTFNNPYGPSFRDMHLDFGISFMRGVSLTAVQRAIATAENEDWVSLAMGLLAGWELRFGDRDSYEVHIDACRRAFGSGVPMEEHSVAMLCDFSFETLRQQLNDLARTGPSSGSTLSEPWNVPSGFNVFSMVHPEVASLICLIRETIHFDPHAKDALAQIRGLGLQIISWTPHHHGTVVPLNALEYGWDATELNALLHVRAALVSIVALHSHICHSIHRATSYLNIMQAVDVHADLCNQLSMNALIGTKFQDVAVCARVVIASISRDSTFDGLLREWLASLSITSWPEREGMMETYALLDTFRASCRDLFHALPP